MSFKEEVSAVRYKYVGNGAWLIGIPKRDISSKDILRFGINEDVLEKSPLYEKILPKKTEIEVEIEVKSSKKKTEPEEEKE